MVTSVSLRQVIALRIDDADLVELAGHALDEPGGERGLAASRRAPDERVRAVGW